MADDSSERLRQYFANWCVLPRSTKQNVSRKLHCWPCPCTVIIVWCAKEGSSRPVIEAHFAGSHDKCLHFQQTHPALPQGAARVKRDLSGVESADAVLGHSHNIEVSWTLTRSIGDAMLDSKLVELPEVCSIGCCVRRTWATRSERVASLSLLPSIPCSNSISWMCLPFRVTLIWTKCRNRFCMNLYRWCSSQVLELERCDCLSWFPLRHFYSLLTPHFAFMYYRMKDKRSFPACCCACL